MIRILISSCLLGEPVRYDGKDARSGDATLERWRREGRLIPICPEVEGGLPAPRPPAEIAGGCVLHVLNGSARVINNLGRDVTRQFMLGAKKALEAAQAGGARLAVLTEKSPSCGSSKVYDGSFSDKLIAGSGVTTALLEQHGIRVFSQLRVREAADYLASLTLE